MPEKVDRGEESLTTTETSSYRCQKALEMDFDERQLKWNDDVCDYVDQATRITSNKSQHPCHQITSDDFSSSRPSIFLHTGAIKETFLTRQVAVKCALIVERK